MNSFQPKINKFIEKLAKTEVSLNTYNQYSYQKPENEIRRKNLGLYFKEVYKFKPKYLLLSEAPGYQGARLTGVPLTSEYILLNGIESLGIFGRNKGYRKTKEFDRERKEPSATIVWKAIAESKQLPLLWGSYPFHPHETDNIWSNRRPSPDEVKLGQQFFKELNNIFGIKEIVAVGRVAQSSLNSLGIECKMIRHPANGGAKLFRQGLFKILK